MIHLIKVGGSVLGAVVILTGSIGGIWSLYDRYKNRRPNLNLFVPENFTGEDRVSKQLFLHILVLISNDSKRNAYLLPFTMSIEIMSDGKWNKIQIGWIGKKKHLETDFDERQKIIHGIDEVEILRRFESPVISYDNPLTRYISITHKNSSILKSIDGVRLKIRDCHFKLYVLSCDLKEQRKKYDPDYLPEGL